MSDRTVTEPTDDTRDLDPLMRDALAWVVRLRSGEATKADLEAVRQWRALGPDHEEAFRQAALLWRDLKTTADNITERRSRRTLMPRALHPGHWSPTRRAFVGGAVAASVAAYMAYDPPMQLWPSLNELSADYRTAKGERRDVALAEGVSVTLNTQTSIAVLPSEQEDPRIELIAGEAAITANRVRGRSLIVQALGARIVAARASFNTRCIDGSLSVTCLTGQLDVEYERSLVQLRQGQQVALSRATGLGLAASIDAGEAAAWHRGLLIVRDRPLTEVVEEVNRYRAGRIVVTSGTLGRRLVNGTFHLERLDNFPSQVRELFGASMRALPGGVVLLS